MDKIEILQPTCVKNFKCIGGECEDSCCKDWNITIDKETYMKYKEIQDPEIKDIVKKKIKLNKKEKNEEIRNVSYAIFKLNKDGGCPFWQEDGLCLLHKKQGAESLCVTCSEYPRSKKVLNDVINYTLSPSCPEAARLILQNKDKIVFEKSEIEEKINKNMVNIKSELLPIIKDFSIDLLQYREINIEERLILLASIFDTVNNDTKQIKTIIPQCREMLENKTFEINIDETMKSKPIQFNLYREMHKSKKGFTSSYANYLDKIFSGLDIKNKDKALEKYKNIKENKYNEFLNEYEYIIENYLVNRVFINEFPYSKNISMSDKCKELLIVYSLLKSTIIGYLSYNENPTEKEIISLVQSFTANIDHKENLFSLYIKNSLLKVSIFDLYNQRKTNSNINVNDMALELLNIAFSSDEKLPYNTVTEVIYFFI